eukprot:gene157-biopygen66
MRPQLTDGFLVGCIMCERELYAGQRKEKSSLSEYPPRFSPLRGAASQHPWNYDPIRRGGTRKIESALAGLGSKAGLRMPV